MPAPLSRRAFLARSTIAGCSLAASPLVTPVSFAAAPWETRLVVIILRGGMDGLAVVQPHGAPEYAGLRPDRQAGPDLDGFFALHPALAPLMGLWARGDLGFVHAVSTPYRDKRSHFDGQDLLEAGTVTLEGVRDGWLNRMLGQMTGVQARTAFAVGRGEMKVLAGPAPVADWTPDAKLTISPQAMRLAELVMQDDPAFHAALSEAAMLSQTRGTRTKGKPHQKIAAFVAEQLRGDTRVASFSINGWDTHRAQQRALNGALGRLSDAILTLRDGVGAAIWERTAIVAMTEFGRTARLNGTGGTDHGTGGAMVLAGGAIRGGRVLGDWPGLDEADLYGRRDLMPTGDVRAPAAWLMRGLAGLERSALERVVFPGLDMGRDPGLLL
ncbi:DUF1501 domain-containing protein [Sedimentitalea nanhaiensis]|uniref:Tat (Twin-arginine translocation) pathway signal sequence n=1 Tax=Sedimentitalea nanhaiensis TaxID=999627 RepID=A0A1I7CEU0_9RHOB|nr:DUF1501 domain-containing protein [Sedimentitalea nanhaiensis]SFT97918.1 Tat (twin-arginine translocation) pathway signal sequence [Sedimentitalea nanhaiensis]